MILETKLSLPQPKPGALLRTGLIELIKNNLDKKLILITADAGYGKTTLLAQLIQQAKLPAVFYSLDNNDSDLLTFYSYLTAGLEKLSPGLVARSSGLLKQGSQISGNYELLMGTLINELVEKRREELFFILDDYQHLAENSPVHAAMDFFIERMPDIVHLIIVSRRAALFPSLASWAARQDAFEISRSDLCFTQAEVHDLLLKSYGQAPSAEDLKSLLEHTEGWITGIQLILWQSVGLEHRKTVKEILSLFMDAGCSRRGGLFDYFANEIFLHETQKVRELLVRSSILECITPEACDALLAAGGSAALLGRLERESMFITVSGAGEYRYHRLFREFLLKQMPSEEERRTLHLKAARHYQQKQASETAVGHFLEAQSYHEAGEELSKISERLAMSARFSMLSDWYSRLPDEILNGSPLLLLDKGNVCQEKGLLDEAMALYCRAEREARARQARGPLAEEDSFLLSRSLLKQSRALWIRGEHHEALSLLPSALKYCPCRRSMLKINILNQTGLLWEAVGNLKRAENCLLRAKRIYRDLENSDTTMVDSNLANLYLHQGQAQKADRLFKTVYNNIQGEYFLGVGIFYANMAKSALLLGDLERAEKYLRQGRDCCLPYEDIKSKAALDNAFGAWHLQLGQWQQASESFGKALASFTRIDWRMGQNLVLQNLIRLYRYCGDLANARRFLAEAMGKNEKADIRADGGLLAEKVLLEIASGEYERAAVTLEKTLGQVRKAGRKMEEFSLQTARVMLHLEKRENTRAIGLLSRLVGLSRDKGYDGILAREIRNNPQLLRLARESKIGKDFLARTGLMKDAVDRKLTVKCFGGLRVFDENGTPLDIKWPTEKSESLFAYMIAHRKSPVQRDVLIELLWPELTPRRGNDNFKTAVYRLRQALAKAIAAQNPRDDIFVICHKHYQLLPGAHLHIDAEDFDNLLAKARQSETEETKAQFYRQALQLYQGDYLPEIYDPWIEPLRQAYCKQRLEILRHLAIIESQKGDYAASVGYCEKYLESAPLSEEITVLCMRNLKELGRIADVKDRYRSLVKALKKELRREPDKETEAVFASLIE